MRIGMVVFGTLMLLAVYSQSAQTRQTPSRSQQEDGRVPFTQAVQELAQKFSVKIVVDPALTMRVRPSTAESLEKALDELVSQVSGAVWRKVYTNKVLGAELRDDQILSATRAMLTIDLGGVVVVDPRANTFNFYGSNYPVSEGFEQSLEQMQPVFNTKPVYVVLSLRAPSTTQNLRGTFQEQYAQLQRQMIDLLMRMSPEERRFALQQGFYAWMNASPELRNQLIFEGMRLSFEYWQSLPPEQQREMIEMGRRWFEQWFQGNGGSYE